MPKISDISTAMEKKIDLTPFFGEDAFITIKRMNKYQFSFLLNKNRDSYSAKLFQLITEWKNNHNEEDILTNAEYDKLKLSISPDEVEKLMIVEHEVNRGYFESSIKSSGHNFTSESNELLEIEGGWFYDNFSSLVDSDGRSITDFVVNEIISFNRSSLSLGESIPSK